MNRNFGGDFKSPVCGFGSFAVYCLPPTIYFVRPPVFAPFIFLPLLYLIIAIRFYPHFSLIRFA